MAIRLRNVSKSFGNPPTRVLQGIDLTIEDGSLLALTGRSGSGKSTLLYIMSTLDTPTGGTVEIDGKNVADFNVKGLHQFRNLNVGFVFQFHYLLPELTALENVLIPALKTKRGAELRPVAQSLLEEVELGNKANRLPSQLSGGEQQRVAIARALILKPRYLFADEPTGNLDTNSGDNVMKLLAKINRERGTTIVYVTHDLDYAAQAKGLVNLVDGAIQSPPPEKS